MNLQLVVCTFCFICFSLLVNSPEKSLSCGIYHCSYEFLELYYLVACIRVATTFGLSILCFNRRPPPPEGGTRYILGWGGAARPLIPWPCLRQISLIFLPCLRQLRFLIPFKTFKVVATRSCVALLLCNQWKFNLPGINAKVNGSQY